MRRLLDVADWKWTDHIDGQPHGRFIYYARSGEFLTTAFLIACAAIMIWPGSTFATSPAFNWISRVSHGNEVPWGVMALALGFISPLAVIWNKGLLRIMSVVSQGTFCLVFGISFRLSSPLGLGQGFFIISGVWLVVRAGFLVRHHWQRG